jgi:shikimate dehydrogenase
MKFAAVLGSPIKHSLSPTIHGAAYRKLGFDAVYEACEVDSQGLQEFLSSKLAQSDWIGFSLTMPLKEKICEIAQDLDISLDDQSIRISSANTLYRDGDSWKGTSTDVLGFSFLLENLDIREATIIGAGGTARAAIEALGEDCAIKIVRRDDKRDDAIRRAFPNREISFSPWVDFDNAWSRTLVVVAVPIEATPDLVKTFRPPEILIDALYSPWLPPVSELQSQSGMKLFSGIDLLCAQALGQIRLMTSETFDENEIFSFLKSVALEVVTNR